MIYITLIGTLICPLRYEQHHLAFAKSNLWSARTSPTSPTGSAHDSSSLSIKGCSASLMPSSLDPHGMDCLCTNSFDWLGRAGWWRGPKHQDARNPPFNPFPFFNHRPFSYSAWPSSWITHPFSTHSAITSTLSIPVPDGQCTMSSTCLLFRPRPLRSSQTWPMSEAVTDLEPGNATECTETLCGFLLRPSPLRP